MAYKVVYFYEVKPDIKEAKLWYKKQSAGLEKRFAKAIKHCITFSLNPYAHAIRYQKVRVTHSSAFPYSVHYYIDENNSSIVLNAVVHDSRNPSFSQEQLQRVVAPFTSLPLNLYHAHEHQRFSRRALSQSDARGTAIANSGNY